MGLWAWAMTSMGTSHSVLLLALFSFSFYSPSHSVLLLTLFSLSMDTPTHVHTRPFPFAHPLPAAQWRTFRVHPPWKTKRAVPKNPFSMATRS